MTIKNEDAKKKEKIVVSDTNTGNIQKVVHLQETQIGTQTTPKDLSVTQDLYVAGDLILEGTGSGSFFGTVYGDVKTPAGLPYIIAGPGVDILTQSTGQVLVRSKDFAYPNELPGLTMWFEAHADNVALTSGKVNKWVDLSGNGNHFYQPSDAQQPVWWSENYNLSGSNGYMPSLEFQGGQYMSSSNNISLGTFTILIGTQVKASQGLFYEHSADVNSNDGSWVFGQSGGAGASMLVRRTSLSGKNMPYGTSWSAQNGFPVIWTHMHAGTHATHRLYINNWDASLTTDSTVNDLGTISASEMMHIGARSGALSPISASIFAFIVYTPALTTKDAARVVKYLGHKFGVTAL